MKTIRRFFVGAAAAILLLIQIACGPSTASTPASTLKPSAVPTPQGTPTGISVTRPPVVTPTYEGVTPTAMPLPTTLVVTPTPAPSSTPAASPTLTPNPNSPTSTPSLPRPTRQAGSTMTREEILELQIELNTTDLEITVIASLDPAVVGEKLAYRLRVNNLGPSPANLTQVVDTLPLGTSYQSDDAACVESPTGTLTCDLGVIWARESKIIIINVMIDADALINEAGPMAITNKATVANLVPMRMLDLGYTARVFPDHDPTNNQVSQETLVVKR